VTVLGGTLAAGDRLRWLTEQLANDGSVTIARAAVALAVSEMTIRRDLAELEARGAARRVRGGARAVGPRSFAERHHTASRAKTRIASKLGGLVPSSGAVALDASSTVMRLAGKLDGARDLTVLTNGPETFGALQGLPGVTALLTGGRFEQRTGSLVGPLAYRSATSFSADVLFASAAAVDPAGTLEPTLEEAEVKRGMAAGAGLVVLAADSSKLSARSVTLGLEWDQIDVLVTELDPSDRRLASYRSLADIL
jgi:DeoR family transcriptional regulator, fructose operon transcriptional repressor